MSQETMNPTGQPTNDMNIFSRIWNVFVAPASTFEAVKVSPKWVVPLIISILIMGGAMHVLTPTVIEESKDKTVEQLEKRGMSDEQIDQALVQAEKMQKYMIVPSTVIASVIFTFLLAAIWLFVANVLAGGQAKYGQILGVYVYAGFIGLLGFLIKLPLMLSQHTMNIHFSPATFMSEASSDTFLYKLLAKFDLFGLWGIVVLGIGLAVVAGLKPKKVLPWVFILYVLWWVGSAALSNMSFM
jgi:hypothetical protein